MAFRLDTTYALIPNPDPRGTFGTMVEMLLNSRLKLHLDEDPAENDEEVNAYLAGLLVSYIDPAYLHGVYPLLSRYDFDLHQSVVRCCEDRVRTYLIYKLNADNLLMSLGVFRRFLPEAESDLGRIRRYYIAASTCQKRIYRRPTAVSEIQDKLAQEAPRYLAILTETRLTYLGFVQQVAPDDWSDFEKRLTP